MPPQRQTRASLGSSSEISKQPSSEMTSRTRSSSKINSRGTPSPRKSGNMSPGRRHFPAASTPPKKNQLQSNSPRSQTQKISGISPKKKMQIQVISSSSTARSPKTTPKKSVSTQSVPFGSSPPLVLLRSTRGKSIENSPSTNVKKGSVKLSGTKSPGKSSSDSLLKSPVKSPAKSPNKSPIKSPSKVLPDKAPNTTPTRASSRSSARSPTKSIAKSPSKSTSKSPVKPPSKLLTKSPTKSSTKSPTKSPSLSAKKSPVKSSSRTPSKANVRISPRGQVSPGKVVAELSPSRPNASSRKRLLTSPSKSPHSAKTRRLRGNIISPVQANIKLDSDEEMCKPLDMKGSGSTVKSSFSHLPRKQSSNTLPTDPELTGRFLRRKWFSLKSRGGFTCLRSAILSPEEVAQEVLQATMVDTPKMEDANFFTTKLMMRLSSRLPPSRARPSCEELVDLIKSKQSEKKFDALTEQKGEGTAIRVKLEKRSFSDTISQIHTKSSKVVESAPCTSKPELEGKFSKDGGSNLSKKREREIALLQLKNLRYW